VSSSNHAAAVASSDNKQVTVGRHGAEIAAVRRNGTELSEVRSGTSARPVSGIMVTHDIIEDDDDDDDDDQRSAAVAVKRGRKKPPTKLRPLLTTVPENVETQPEGDDKRPRLSDKQNMETQHEDEGKRARHNVEIQHESDGKRSELNDKNNVETQPECDSKRAGDNVEIQPQREGKQASLGDKHDVEIEPECEGKRPKLSDKNNVEKQPESDSKRASLGDKHSVEMQPEGDGKRPRLSDKRGAELKKSDGIKSSSNVETQIMEKVSDDSSFTELGNSVEQLPDEDEQVRVTSGSEGQEENTAKDSCQSTPTCTVTSGKSQSVMMSGIPQSVVGEPGSVLERSGKNWKHGEDMKEPRDGMMMMGFTSDGNSQGDQTVPQYQSDTEDNAKTDGVASDGHVAITSELAVHKDEMPQSPTSSVSGAAVSTQFTDNDTITAAQAEGGSRVENETEIAVTSGIYHQTVSGQPGPANDGENESSSDSPGQRDSDVTASAADSDDVTKDVMTSRDDVTPRRQLRSRFVVPVKRE